MSKGLPHIPLVRLTVRVKPRAKTSRILRVDGLSVEVSLAAPPVDDAANEELVAFLSRVLGVRRRSLHLAIGATSRTKVDVAGSTKPRFAHDSRVRRRPMRKSLPARLVETAQRFNQRSISGRRSAFFDGLSRFEQP
jgi:uncharacterized protein YggU (UPF0235/DUF167 family)